MISEDLNRMVKDMSALFNQFQVEHAAFSSMERGFKNHAKAARSLTIKLCKIAKRYRKTSIDLCKGMD